MDERAKWWAKIAALLVECFLESRRAPDVKDASKHGRVLDLTSHRGHVKVVEFLLPKGAADTENRYSEQAVRAIKCHRLEIISILLEHETITSSKYGSYIDGPRKAVIITAELEEN
ncbi:hypothetical protein EG328_004587 [Venturia inaequalis]|uniref:Uncharacterized protein n=1 Tax=Venturia inaequalis TaxID=5025 RepID=A0A8H3VH07_VENIN|nr:hypothetical protein EG327_006399 [Venturia inaequalis]KAE9986868.1 hypothetical protein EG328_004587 [Venturia inaequalis]